MEQVLRLIRGSIMNRRYRIIISGRTIYKEIEVDSKSKKISFGTEIGCDIRVRKNLFFEPIEIIFIKNDVDEWNMICSDNLYIHTDEVWKMMKVSIKHGTEILVKYQNSLADVFTVTLLIDFDYENKSYDRRYYISNLSEFSIGTATDNNIVINGKYTENDKVLITNNEKQLNLNVINTSYGVYHNGNLIENRAEIKNKDFFSIGDYSFYYKNGYIFTQKSSQIRENGVEYSDSTNRNQYPKFNRNSRIKTKVNDSKIEILDPPAKPKKQKENLFTRLFPSIVMIVVSVVMGIKGGVFVYVSIASAVAGIITSIITVSQSKKEYRIELTERIEKYNKYIERKKEELGSARDEELKIVNNTYISYEEEIQNLKNFSYKLFDRCPEDDDFLDVRLGTGNLEAKRKVEYKKQERLEIEDELQNYPRELYEQYKFLNNAPIVCNFKNANAIGIVGDEKSRFETMKNTILDLCTRQYYSDVKLFFVVENKNYEKVKWLRMLPNVQNEILGIHNIVCDDDSKNIIYEYLYKELSKRMENKSELPHLIVYLYDEYGFKSHPISKFVDVAKKLGVTFIFFGDSYADIGLGCDYIIKCEQDENAVLLNTSDSSDAKRYAYNNISDNNMKAMVQLLAPVYCEEISLESTLTKNISLFELLNIIAVDDLNLEERWKYSKVYESMKAPIGITKSGILSLDLHDKYDGPHGLVAGTTGSGKSELLQTYILAMATLYHPYEVSFLIIDFKGGGMANQFKELPHLIGTITNIDGREIERSLKSIKAELKKRQKLFASVNVNHIDKYIIKYREGQVAVPLPHLIIIVDEFAELKADQPEFMKELISTARIGRSLGVHLILATQKPSGQVDEQIWSNSRFKICLKVQSAQDSNEVLKSPLAAEIKEAGRAYLQVGNNESFDLFQSAYSGAHENLEEQSTKEFTIYEITASGKRIPVYTQKKEKNSNGRTQLNAIVQYINDYTRRMKIDKLPEICMPPLPKVIDFPIDKFDKNSNSKIIADIGIYDNPDMQKQDIYSLNLSIENVMIIGSAQMGKTNILQTVIKSLAIKYSPEDVNIYIIDFASMYLKNYEKLNHVGGIVTPAEDEKFKNLFKYLYKEMDIRRKKLLQEGASSYIAYREMGKKDIPAIVLIIDNLTMINELYLSDDDVLLPICREGLSLGISVIVANAQTTGIGYKYLSNFEKKIALNCNDTSEYNILFGYSKIRPLNIKGRAIVELQKEILEAQMFKAFLGEKEYERTKYISKFIESVNKQYEGYRAPKIPSVPEELTEKIFYALYKIKRNMQNLYIGVSFDDIEPVEINWNRQVVFGISGKESKNVFLEYLKRALMKDEYKCYIIDDYTGMFEDVSREENTELYTRNSEDSEEIFSDVTSELERRMAIRDLKGTKSLEEMKKIIVIIHNNDWLSYAGTNKKLLDMYKDIIKRYKGLKCCIMFTNLENEKISTYNAPEVLKVFNERPYLLVFEDIQDIKIFDTTTTMRQKFNKRLREGEAFMLSNNVLSKIKTIK